MVVEKIHLIFSNTILFLFVIDTHIMKNNPAHCIQQTHENKTTVWNKMIYI
jgi:hypothetical protein